MIKITHDGIASFIKDYSLTKKLDELSIITECDTEVRFEDPTFHTLLERTAQGAQADDVDVEINCGNAIENYDGYIEHGEGSFNLKTCVADKKIKFKNIFECVKLITGNIFNEIAYDTQTIQGTIQRTHFSKVVTVYYNDDYIPTYDEVLSHFAIPPHPLSYTEYRRVTAIPLIYWVPDPSGGWDIPEYAGHQLEILERYVTFVSPTQINSDWLPHPLGGYYYNPALLPELIQGSPNYNTVEIGVQPDERYYIGASWEDGRMGVYTDTKISNTYSLNDVINQVFSCSGVTLVSDFFGINPTNDSPLNKAYDFAAKYCQEIRIVQSFDIIREGATNDSFGKSGEFDAKKMIVDINRLFNLILFYDEVNNVLRWEHVTYLNTKGIDFVNNSYPYEFSGELEVNKNSINLERWQMAGESATDGFWKTEIDYKNYSINEAINETTIKMEYILTDLTDMLNNEKYNDNSYSKMFFLLSVTNGEVNAFNTPFSIRNIVKNLHTINRPIKSGWLDGTRTLFDGYSMGLSGEIKWFGSISMFRKLSPLNSVLLESGTYIIEEINMERDVITFKIQK